MAASQAQIDKLAAKHAEGNDLGNTMGVKVSEDVSLLYEVDWDVVVIGSGYGGSIAASRLARTGKKVVLLEKGKEFRPGHYPETFSETQKEIQLHVDGKSVAEENGLYEFRLEKDINVFKGCGLGGTSLVNAGVALEADPRVYKNTNWPQEIRDEMAEKKFDQWYDKAREMLEPSSYPDNKTLPKIKAMEAAAAFENGQPVNTENGSKKIPHFYRPLINVNFKDKVNKEGLFQPACTDCGDCVTGCNVGAKNTLIMNYIPDAKNNGAKIYTSVDVRSVSKRADGKWTVWYNPIGPREKFKGAGEMFLHAQVVVVSGGTLGSTEIMLRSKERGLPLSDYIGHRFSGNGDLLGFAFDTKYQIENIIDHERKVGPCITTVIDRRALPGEDLLKGFVVEDGTHPIAIAQIYASMLCAAHPLFKNTFERYLQENSDILIEKAFDRSLSFLVMAQDTSQGTMKLNKDALVVDWPQAGKDPFINNAYDYLRKISTGPLGAQFIEDPITSDLLRKKQLITVHPLGGCVMGSSVAESVVNHKCQVWNPAGGVHEGLYVMDGSVIPTCIGVNPLYTISAVSERAVSLLATDFQWKIREGYDMVPKPVKNTKIGIIFTEAMSGWFTVGEFKDFEAGMKEGKKSNTNVSFTISVTCPDLDAFIASPDHAAFFSGTLQCPVLSKDDLVVTKGIFSLFVDDPDVIDQKLMKYTFNVEDKDGNKYFYYGFKVVKDNMKGLNSLEQTTTLYSTIYKGEKEDPAQMLGRGITYVHAEDFSHQLRNITIINAPDRTTRLEYYLKFVKYFAGSLWEIYGDVGSTTGTTKDPRKKRILNLPVPQVYDVITSDGLNLRLIRYMQPEGKPAKGPLMCNHGAGVSSRIFLVDTIQVSMAEYLYEAGYDLWLFDYRLSCDLPYAEEVKDADIIAQTDYVAAIDKILEVTGKKDVQVFGHCFGSTTFFMAMSTGKLAGKVRCMACTGVMFNTIPGPFKGVQSSIHLPQIVDLFKHSVNPAVDSGLFNKLTSSQAAAAVEHSERCDSRCCHRISFLYGLPYVHAQLNTATHNVQNEIFGGVSLKVFEHVSAMCVAGKVVDHKGKDIYMPSMAEKLANVPILTLTGEKNQLWIPESTAKSYNFLAEANGPGLLTRIVIPQYGHLDLIYGKNANKDVYPQIVKFLDSFNKQDHA